MFLELDSTNDQYCEKLQAHKSNPNALFTAGWKVEEQKQLVDYLQNGIHSVISVKSSITDNTIDVIEANVARQLSSIRKTATTLIRDLSRHKRVSLKGYQSITEKFLIISLYVISKARRHKSTFHK